MSRTTTDHGTSADQRLARRPVMAAAAYTTVSVAYAVAAASVLGHFLT